MSLKTGIVTFGTNALRYCRVNASGILTITAMIGVAATAIIYSECVKKAEEKIEEEEEIKGEPLEPIEKAKATWYYYIPPVVCGVVTMACIGGAHGIDKKKQLELVAAYNILKEGSDKFKKYAIDEIGQNKVRQIEHKIHEDDLKAHPVSKEINLDDFDATKGGVIVKDPNYTGLTFTTTYEKIYRAAERANAKLRLLDGGGKDWWSWAKFIEDCGGEYCPACEDWGFYPIPFKDVIDKNHICDPCIEEVNGHYCTVVYFNITPDKRSLYEANF